MANAQHLAELQRPDGVQGWNQWREQHPETKPDLAGAQLDKKTLSGANLVSVNLRGANLKGANLNSAVLHGADLFQADLSGADLRDAQGVILDATNIRNARFSAGAKDPWSILRRNYTGTKLFFHLFLLSAFLLPFAVRTLMWVGVNHAQEALMRGQQHLKEARAELRQRLTFITTSLDEAAQRLHREGGDESTTVSRATEGISKLLDQVRELGGVLDRALVDAMAVTEQPCLSGNCRQFRVAQILLDMDQAPVYWLLAIALLVYNILRVVLTWSVGSLRDEEERSGYSPTFRKRPNPDIAKTLNTLEWMLNQDELAKIVAQTPLQKWMMQFGVKTVRHGWPAIVGIRGYAGLMRLHKVMKVLIFVAVSSFVWHFWHWLTAPVWLPN